MLLVVDAHKTLTTHPDDQRVRFHSWRQEEIKCSEVLVMVDPSVIAMEKGRGHSGGQRTTLYCNVQRRSVLRV